VHIQLENSSREDQIADMQLRHEEEMAEERRRRRDLEDIVREEREQRFRSEAVRPRRRFEDRPSMATVVEEEGRQRYDEARRAANRYRQGLGQPELPQRYSREARGSRFDHD